MKNSLLIAFLFITLFSWSQNNLGDQKVKLEIRSTKTDNEIHRVTNEHKLERIDLRKEDQKDHTHKPELHRHNRPNLDRKNEDKISNKEVKKERRSEIKHEHRQDKLHQHRDRRENIGK
jgi:hypothetical protein